MSIRYNKSLAHISVFTLLCVLPQLTLQAQTAQSPQQRRQAVEDHLSRYVVIQGAKNEQMTLAAQMKAMHVPAVSIAAIHNGAIDWAQAFGVNSLNGPPATTETLFGTASISKPVTALGVLKLVEEGKIDLDANVNQYLKRWQIPDNEFTAKNKVTVRELLSHTSGIGTHNGEIYDPAAPIPTLVQQLNDEKPAKIPPVRVEAIPGTKFAYANGGYLVLYLLIEDVTGEPFATWMKRNVLDPIGMIHSTFEAPLPLAQQQQAATAYGDDYKSAIPPAKFVEANLAAGGLWSTPTDLAKLLIEVRREYEGKSHLVLHQKTMQTMLTPGTGFSPQRPYGLGFEVGPNPQARYIRHEGSAFYQDDMVEYLNSESASGNGIVIMTSGGGGSALADELLRSAAQVYNFPDFKSVTHKVISIPPSSLPRFAGTYSYVKVALEGDHLTAEIPIGSPTARLYAESPNHFFVLDGPQELTFKLDAQQKVTGVDFSTPMGHHPLDKSSAQ